MNKEEVIPLYRRVIEDLKGQIENGQYKEGDLLPSENDLCKTYNTTRATIRLSLTQLSSGGYILRQHGKGSIVKEPKKGLGILSIKGVTAGVGNLKLETKILKRPEITKWPSDFFYNLDEGEQTAGCVLFTRIRIVNDAPVLFEETYITNNNISDFISQDLSNKSLFQTLKDFYNLEIKEGEQKIWAISATEGISQLLEIQPGKPLLKMERKLQTNKKELNIYSLLYCNTEEYFLYDNF